MAGDRKHPSTVRAANITDVAPADTSRHTVFEVRPPVMADMQSQSGRRDLIAEAVPEAALNLLTHLQRLGGGRFESGHRSELMPVGEMSKVILDCLCS